ncbi:MAG: hypothetical protein ACLSFA_20170 [Roseburia inulinivorans]
MQIRLQQTFNTQETVDLLNKYKEYTDKGVIPKTKWGDWDEMLKLLNPKTGNRKLFRFLTFQNQR